MPVSHLHQHITMKPMSEKNTDLITSCLKEVGKWEILQHMTTCHLVTSAACGLCHLTILAWEAEHSNTLSEYLPWV